MKKITVFVWLFTLHASLLSQTCTIKGQASGWVLSDEAGLDETQFGLRYISTLSFEMHMTPTHFVDAEIAFNLSGFGDVNSPENVYENSDLETYRLWLRFASSQLEIRVGLQKINFGSALLLRPLMWFDRIDPRDPLKLTNGVYGLLARYYFVNNANIWLWGLYGNDETRGWEIFPSADKKLEIGGRVQYPLGTGEIAVSYHHREADLGKSEFAAFLPDSDPIPENRFAIDGKWDLGISLWFEGLILHQASAILPIAYQHFVTTGADYTFAVGSGLHLLGEHLRLMLAKEAFSSEDSFDISAVTVDYNHGMLDRFIAIAYYDWENADWSRYASWGRIYDNWSFYLNIFWNPDNTSILSFQQNLQNSFMAGKGLQLMVVFNH